MTAYTVKQVASLAGISVRTLHYYDQVGLLKPRYRRENGYRYYDEDSTIRLQQIMFFRELGFSLDEIGKMVSRPDFDMLEALKSQRRLLVGKSERLGELIAVVDKTIQRLKGEDKMQLTTDLPLPLFVRGKVRDTYDLGQYLLIIATDRLSAFDVVLPCGIPDKGTVLNQISAYWFEQTKHIIPNHVVENVTDVRVLDKYLPPAQRFAYPSYLAGRSMVVKKLQRLPIECVVRGYLAGSAWEEYKKSSTLFGERAPKGLQESQELPRPIFTPTTKAETGHDEPMTMDAVQKAVGTSVAEQLRDKSIEIYGFARKQAIAKGIIIADTKMEFGLENGNLVLIDELLTPDSSRFWDVKLYKVGQSQPSYDKQPVRDWLTQSGWNKLPPAPMLPDEVIESTARIYRTAYERLTGRKLTDPA
jgi:phosphoribosylaminoimidazole-succinocarboxamide synthase